MPATSNPGRRLSHESTAVRHPTSVTVAMIVTTGEDPYQEVKHTAFSTNEITT